MEINRAIQDNFKRAYVMMFFLHIVLIMMRDICSCSCTTVSRCIKHLAHFI